MDIASLMGITQAPKATSASAPITDASAEATGGQSAAYAATGPVMDTENEKFILYGSVGVIIGCLVLLWLLGGFAFRGLPSI